MNRLFSTFILGLLLVSCYDLEDAAMPGALVPLTVDQNPRLPSLPINDTLLHAEHHGNPVDPLIIVLHGGPGADYRSMLNLKALVDDGFQIVFYDQRGSGLSKREDRRQYLGGDAIQMFIDDLDAIVAHFQAANTQKIILIGHSWGAMLATAYINQHPEKVGGAILAEPGGFTWTQTQEYLSKSNKIKFFSEALNDAIFPEQIFAGRSEHEILDYKSAYFTTFENAPGNTIGNAGPYPFWRSGAVAMDALIEHADTYDFDFTTNLNRYTSRVLFLYSQLNRAYPMEWAQTVSAPYPNVDIQMIRNTGHEMIHFGWADFYPKALTYLNEIK